MRIMQAENGHHRTRIGGRLANVEAINRRLARSLILPSSQAQAQVSPAVQRGLQFSQTNCSRCHSIDKVSPGLCPSRRPFRTLHERYPVENLQVPLSEGIRTGHPTMPEFRLDPGQIADLIAVLNTLK